MLNSQQPAYGAQDTRYQQSYTPQDYSQTAYGSTTDYGQATQDGSYATAQYDDRSYSGYGE